jgi:hypothetical protein
MNDQHYQRVVAGLKVGHPDDHERTTLEAMVEAIAVLQQKALQQHAQIAALRADVARLQSGRVGEEGES